MNVVVIGSGGREHALAWRLSRSPRVDKVFSCPGNGGLASLGERWQDVSPSDFEALLARIKESNVEFAIVGPEDPLVNGLGDKLRAAGIATFGPGAAASQLEGSKLFAKEFMSRHGIPTASHAVVEDINEIENTLEKFSGPTVIKADGLAAGKGVIVTNDHDEAAQAISSMITDRRFGDAGLKVVVEERLTGVEVTQLVFVSGKQYALLDTAQDYKPLLDGNRGPNTGGMGSYSPTQLLDTTLQAQIVGEILEPTLAGLKAEGIEYRGVLYIGLMLTPTGPQVLEYNVRFGDPETQPLLMRLKTDLLDVFEAMEEQRLDEIELEWDERSALCLVLASDGYPESYATKLAMKGNLTSDPASDVQVFHAGTESSEPGKFETAGGRVLGVTALGDTLEEARAKAFARADEIDYAGKTHRTDIGVFGITAS